MFARILLLLPLLVSLLCAGPVAPETREAAPRDPGACVGMACLKGCCTNKACCESAQQKQAPKPPAPLAARPDLQLATPSFQVFAMVYVRPPETQDFITVDEECARHTLPPRAQSCIQLI